MAGDEALKDLGQVDVRVHTVEFRGFDQWGDDGMAAALLLG
jgi:hypothetical protein